MKDLKILLLASLFKNMNVVPLSTRASAGLVASLTVLEATDGPDGLVEVVFVVAVVLGVAVVFEFTVVLEFAVVLEVVVLLEASVVIEVELMFEVELVFALIAEAEA